MISGAVLVVAHPDGRFAVTRQGHLRLPTVVRHLLALQAGDRLLVAAFPKRGYLVGYSMNTLDAMVLAHHVAATERRQQ